MIKIYNKKYATYELDKINKDEFMGFIYITINKLNNKKYIGQHTKWSKNYLGSGKYLNRAINKYGRMNFERYIIDLAKTQKELDEKETFYINQEFNVNICLSSDWYNIKDGAQNGGNCFLGKSKEDMKKVRNKMSESYKKRMENGDRPPAQGMTHTEDTKRKISLKLKGRKKPEGMGEKLSKTMKSRVHHTQRLGHTLESNKKRAVALMGEKSPCANLVFAKLPNGEVVQGYGMREMHEILLQYGYDVPPRSINTSAKGKSGIYRKFGIKFWREVKDGRNINATS